MEPPTSAPHHYTSRAPAALGGGDLDDEDLDELDTDLILSSLIPPLPGLGPHLHLPRRPPQKTRLDKNHPKSANSIRRVVGAFGAGDPDPTKSLRRGGGGARGWVRGWAAVGKGTLRGTSQGRRAWPGLDALGCPGWPTCLILVLLEPLISYVSTPRPPSLFPRLPYSRGGHPATSTGRVSTVRRLFFSYPR